MTIQNAQLTVQTGNEQTVTSFKQVLANYEKSIAQLLHEKYGISPQEFYVSAVNAIKKQPKLLQCDPRSLFGAILLSAEVGLRFNTPEQHAFILPYGKQAKFQIGYKGLIEMMYRNPRVLSITAEVVKENDEFDYAYGMNPYLTHKPLRKGDRGKVDAVYAVCKLKDADPIFTVIEKDELDKIKTYSKSLTSGTTSAWDNDIHHFMEIKGGIKKLSKLIPTSSKLEISKAIDYDSRFEGGARVWAELPNSADDIILPSLSDDDNNKLENSFDGFIENETEVPKKEVPKKETPKLKKEVTKESKKAESSKEVDFSSIGNVNKEESEEEKIDKKIDISGVDFEDQEDDEPMQTLF